MKKRLLITGMVALSAGTFAGNWIDGGDGLWSNMGNWHDSTVPVLSNYATFYSVGATAVDLGAGANLRGMTFAGSQAYMIGTSSAQALGIGKDSWGGFTLTADNTADQTIAASVDASHGAWVNDSAKTLNVTGDILGSGNIWFDGGKFNLTGDNTARTGGTRVLDGAEVTASSWNGTASNIEGVEGKFIGNYSATGGMDMGHTAATGDFEYEIGTGHSITLNDHIDYRASTEAGVGNATTISGGTLDLNDQWRSVIVSDNSNLGAEDAELTIASTIKGDDFDSLTKKGAGTLRLTGADNNNETTGFRFLGIQEGKVQIDSATAIGNDRINLGKDNTAQDATLEFVGSTDTIIDEYIRFEGVDGTDTILANGDNASLRINRFDASVNGTTGLQNGEGAALTLGGENKNLNTIRDNLNDLNGLTNGLTKTGSGTWGLYTAQTYTGDTDVQAGTLVLMDEDTRSAGTTYSVSDGGTLSFKLGGTDGGGWVDEIAVKTAVTNIGTGFADGATIGVYVDTADTFNWTDTESVIDQATLGGTVGFRKTGDGELVINRNMVLGGDVLVDEGTLTLGNGYGSGSFGANAAKDLFDANATIADGATLGINKANNDTVMSGVLSGTGNITITNSRTDDIRGLILTSDNDYTGNVHVQKGRLQVGENTATGTFKGSVVVDSGSEVAFNRSTVYTNEATSISGAGSVRQTGKEALHITSANTYTGGTTIEEDDLYLWDENGLGTGGITLQDNGINPRLLLKKAGVTYANDIVFADVGTGSKKLSFWESGAATVSGDIALDETDSNLSFITTGQSGNNTATLTLSGDISGAGGFKKGGNAKGVLVLTGANTYSGETIVEEGTLIINGDNSGAIGAVTIGENGLLMGGGTIGGAVTVEGGGFLNPGNSPGTLTFNENLTLEDLSTLTLEFVDNGSFDILANDGEDTLTADSGANIVLDFTGATYGIGDNIAVFENWSGLVNRGANISIVGTDSGNVDVSNLFSTGVVEVTAAIPEPAVISLVGIFGLGILVVKRRFS